MAIPLHTVPGSELPELLWYHRAADDARHVTARFRPPLFDGWRSKPDGGLWAAVARDFAGPALSDWGLFEDHTEVKGHVYVSRLVPNPDARFVVVDSGADGAALAQAFPGVEGASTLAKLLGKDLDDFKERVPDPSPQLASLLGYGRQKPPLVDFTLLAQHQYAGVYLTPRGLMECRLPLPPGVPDLWCWDVETVWFRTPELHVEDTRRWESV